MDNRRSSRSRKKVKYAKFSESSDDDFEEKNASVTKKQKGEKNGLLKSNKKKPERKEAKSSASDVPSRSSDSEKEKTVLLKDVAITLQPYQKDKKSKDEPDHIKANSENYNKIEAGQEQKENICNIELTNREVKQKNKNQVDTKEDVECSFSSEEEMDKNADDKDLKESSDECSDGKKSSKKSQSKMKKDVEYTISSEEDENRDDKDWKENSDESDDGKSKSSKKSQVKMKKEKGVCVNHSRTPARQAKKEGVQTHLTAKSKVINYCAKKPLNLPAVKLRLGLSRKASIKPLHSAVKVQQ